MYLGLDIGTSGVKTCVIDQTGDVMATSHAALSTSHPFESASEQHCDQWWQAAFREKHLVCPVDAPFDLRLRLKERGYRWRPAELLSGKVWWTITLDPEAEIAWLRSEIYGRQATVPIRKVTAMNRISERIW